jgi:ATP-dependent helicase/nuclease subunit A
MSDAAALPVALSLTRQQRRALEVSDASVALSSGAGCGKTTVLTERFLSALDESGGRPLRALVALTFTEKAARELRHRIRKQCRERLASGEDAARWWAVLRGLDAAPIGTFHEFCARLLRRHALHAGIDPEFAILDESIAASLREEAVRAALRRLLAARDADLIDLATDYGLRQVRDALGPLASGRAAPDIEAWSQLALEAIVERWQVLMGNRVWPAARDMAWPHVRRCRRLLEGLDSREPKIRERRAALLDALDRLVPEALPCPAADLDELVALLRVSDLPRKKGWPSDQVHDEIRDAFEALREEIKDHVKPAITWDGPGALAEAQQGLRFARLLLAVRREYDRLKRRRRGLDFDDLLIRARDLIRDHLEAVLRAPAGDAPLFEFVLVDEFQDTDAVQSEILRLLAGSEFLAGRLFVVGDVKQSIYRFRGAEPSIFQEWRAEFLEKGRLNLTENFRSVPGIVQFVNALFGDCFLDIDPIAQSEAGGHRLLPVRREDTCQPVVEFLWPDLGNPDLEAAVDEQARRTAHDRRTIEAACLARRLRERLDAGWTIFDRHSKTTRPAHPGDVALLFRAMTDLWPYESALANEGFDYHTIGGSAFYAQQEVHDVINLLSVVEDPLDEVALAGALRSPFFGLSDEGLFWLATTFPDRGLTAGLFRVAEIAQLSPLDRERAERALALLSRRRAVKDRVPMAHLVAQVLDESGFEGALVCEFLGERKLANTRKIIRLARDFDRQGGFTLADFVARLRADLENEPREEQAATTDESSESIRLMSIHQSKGLEFPIVVLPDLDRARSGQSPLVAHHAEFGLLVRPPQPSPSLGESADDPSVPGVAWQAYRKLDRALDEQESRRLFYVAATRARDALILSAGRPPGESVPRSATAIQLLDERFDRRTGECRIEAWRQGERPLVQVTMMRPPEPGDEPGADAPRRKDSSRSQSRGASIAAIEKTIAQAAPLPPAQPQMRPAVPRYVALDPENGLSPRAARLDRLVRSLLRDLRWQSGMTLGEVAAVAAARQSPAASPGLVREALRRVSPWPTFPVFRHLRTADPATVQHDLTFTMPCPLDGAASTVFHGTCDLVFRDAEGHWTVLIVADSGASRAHQSLRVQLAGLAASARGFGPARRGWLIRHGAEGSEAEEIELILDAHENGRRLAELARALHP